VAAREILRRIGHLRPAESKSEPEIRDLETMTDFTG